MVLWGGDDQKAFVDALARVLFNDRTSSNPTGGMTGISHILPVGYEAITSTHTASIPPYNAAALLACKGGSHFNLKFGLFVDFEFLTEMGSWG